MGSVAVLAALATVDAVVETTLRPLRTTGESQVAVAAWPTVVAARLIAWPVNVDARSDCSYAMLNTERKKGVVGANLCLGVSFLCLS